MGWSGVGWGGVGWGRVGIDPGVRSHGMKANPTGFLWSKYECFLISGCQDIDF